MQKDKIIRIFSSNFNLPGMKIQQFQWMSEYGWKPAILKIPDFNPNLILLFGNKDNIWQPEIIKPILKHFSNAHILGCSTAGEILKTQVFDNSISLTAIEFKKTELQSHSININNFSNSYEAGEKLARQFKTDGLQHLFVLSEGTKVNGSELVKGLSGHLPPHVSITGGLAGDGAHFMDTLIIHNETVNNDMIAAVGFYGESIKIGYSSFGGWDTFGPERLITKSKNNILFELDGKNALNLYKQYLGDYAKDLPASGLLFPLNIKKFAHDKGVVRTILGIDETKQSMTFAGDMPQGWIAQLMIANNNKLIEGARQAANNIREQHHFDNQFAILISCVGRKLVLKHRSEEEIEAVKNTLGTNAIVTGFYSYGEISPVSRDLPCELHNQTMTITTLSEI